MMSATAKLPGVVSKRERIGYEPNSYLLIEANSGNVHISGFVGVNVWVELGAINETWVQELDVKKVLVVFGLVQVVGVVDLFLIQIPNFKGAIS